MTQMEFMVEDISSELVVLLMEEHHMSMDKALRALYTSDTYARLISPTSGLCTQSTAYVYEYLEHELATGKVA